MRNLLPRKKIALGAIAMQVWVVAQIALNEFVGFELSALLASEATLLIGLGVSYFTPASPEMDSLALEAEESSFGHEEEL